MEKIRIEKVVINIGVGESGERLERAKKLLESITGKTVVKTKTKKRTTFGMSKGREIGVKITLRNDDATKFLNRIFESKDKKISKRCFDKNGNFSIGIHEHIDIPGVKYDPKIGIFGMDVCVTLERPGFRVKRKKLYSRIGKTHRISREDAIGFIKKEFGVEVI